MRLGSLVTPVPSNMFPRFDLMQRRLLKDWPFRRFSAIFFPFCVASWDAWSYIGRHIRTRLGSLVTPVPSNMFPRFDLVLRCLLEDWLFRRFSAIFFPFVLLLGMRGVILSGMYGCVSARSSRPCHPICFHVSNWCSGACSKIGLFVAFRPSSWLLMFFFAVRGVIFGGLFGCVSAHARAIKYVTTFRIGPAVLARRLAFSVAFWPSSWLLMFFFAMRGVILGGILERVSTCSSRPCHPICFHVSN